MATQSFNSVFKLSVEGAETLFKILDKNIMETEIEKKNRQIKMKKNSIEAEKAMEFLKAKYGERKE